MATYQDFNILFTTDASTNDFDLVTDDDAIQQSMMSLIQTDQFERLHQPLLYCGIKGQLFELITPITRNVMQNSIMTCLQNYEPRATVSNVTVKAVPTKNAINISITYTTKSAITPVTFDFLLTRVR